MPEQYDLTTPIPFASRTGYKIVSLLLGWENQTIAITLRGSDNVTLTFYYTGTEAANLMSTLNTANLSTNSLYKRILTKLASDNYLPVGTITGTPE